jgi:integration host factor subunit alpha
MTKTDLMDLLFHHHGLRRDEASTIVERIFRAMSDTLRRGDEVKITNFGVFEVRTRAARPGRNPRTGESVPIPPRRVVVFRAAEALQINEDMVSSLKGETDGR